jgi:hypothetical protein
MWHFSGLAPGFVPQGSDQGGDFAMFVTIQIGRYLSVQGRLVRRLPGGLAAVRVGAQVFVGRPVPRAEENRAA